MSRLRINGVQIFLNISPKTHFITVLLNVFPTKLSSKVHFRDTFFGSCKPVKDKTHSGVSCIRQWDTQWHFYTKYIAQSDAASYCHIKYYLCPFNIQRETGCDSTGIWVLVRACVHKERTYNRAAQSVSTVAKVPIEKQYRSIVSASQ